MINFKHNVNKKATKKLLKYFTVPFFTLTIIFKNSRIVVVINKEFKLSTYNKN